jgi:UDP-N-acetylglucosamine transferase subunit ALG13
MSPLVLTLTGTDHHPFNRLVEWVDVVAEAHPDARFVVQYGASRAPRVADGQGFLTHELMAGLLLEASVVVCHGGPGTITDAREAGHIPLCVPRDPRLGEHVDGHQQRFASLIGQSGVARDVRSFDAFQHELAVALAQAREEHLTALPTGVRDAARARAAAELDEVMGAVRVPLRGSVWRRHGRPVS